MSSYWSESMGKSEVTSMVASLTGRLRASLTGRLMAFHPPPPPDHKAGGVPSLQRGCSRWRDLSLTGTGGPTC